jgi:predicted DNA binding CopG/RHH family protein
MAWSEEMKITLDLLKAYLGERVNYPLRLPVGLYNQVTQKAKRQGMSLSSYLIDLIHRDVINKD